MAETEKFDVIVVGAGPAGTAAALTAARLGLSTVLIERGDYPGAKNLMGGVLYRKMLEDIVPNFWEEAPLERHVIETRLAFLDADSQFTLAFRDPKFDEPPYNSFTVLRAKFDRWFAEKAEAAGAFLITGMPIVKVLKDEHGKAIGVSTGSPDGELYADVVIIADGVNSLLSMDLGLRGELDPHHVALAVKEVISLPAEKIQDRFNVEGRQGVVMEIMGASKGMVGQGFLYTNYDSISIGIGCLLSDFQKTFVKPYDLLEDLKHHPTIRPLLEGGETEEYTAHLIPEGGYDAMPRIYGDGFMVVGDAAMLVNVLHREGSNLAMTSGRIAAETAAFAKEQGDFSARTLSRYHKALEESFVLQDLRQYRKLPHFIDARKQFFDLYPRLLNHAAREIVTVDGTPKKVKERGILKEALRHRPLAGFLSDLVGFWRAVR